MGIQKHSFPVEEMLNVASSRLRRQTQFRRLLAKGGRSAAELERWLEQAYACLATLAQPVAVFRPLATQVDLGQVNIENQVTMNNPALATDLNSGSSLSTYLLTLGYSQAKAFDWLDRDYMVHHVQSELAREVLYALGRAAHKCAKDVNRDHRLRRIPVRQEAMPGGSSLWDASRVQALLTVFGKDNPGVSLTDAGCFQPLSSLLGLMMIYPPKVVKITSPAAIY
ncbi:MAG: hypothetical protein GY742_05790 [Hyphomicrobiales bacterium]|nr:hypothetical protein [Hyphomicrobiales bacterium]